MSRRTRPLLAIVLGVAGLAAAGVAAGAVAPAAMRGRLVTRTLWSTALERRERVLLYLPPGYARTRATYPLVVLLHGVPGRPEDFVSHGMVARIDALVSSGRISPFVAALPQGSDKPADDNEWADSARRPGERWESYLATDVVGFVQSRYRVRRDPGGRAIAGVSMGGFGAMNVALHHRDEFGTVASWSGYFNANTPSVHDPASAEGRAYSPQLYAGALRPALAAWHPAIEFYVGDRDRFAGENAAFDRTLADLHVPHRFRLVPGAGHGWALWTAQLDRELGFLEAGLGRTGGRAASTN